MPLYFFDLHNDVDASDPEGQELRDLAAAIAEAIKDARELMGASIKQEGKINLRHYINIRDEHGQVVHTVRFADAVTVLRGRIFLIGLRLAISRRSLTRQLRRNAALTGKDGAKDSSRTLSCPRLAPESLVCDHRNAPGATRDARQHACGFFPYAVPCSHWGGPRP